MLRRPGFLPARPLTGAGRPFSRRTRPGTLPVGRDATPFGARTSGTVNADPSAEPLGEILVLLAPRCAAVHLSFHDARKHWCSILCAQAVLPRSQTLARIAAFVRPQPQNSRNW